MDWNLSNSSSEKMAQNTFIDSVKIIVKPIKKRSVCLVLGNECGSNESCSHTFLLPYNELKTPLICPLSLRVCVSNCF